jgi:signal transduction histidine kinase
MKIQTKLLLIIGGMLVLIFISISYFNYHTAIKNAQQDLFDQAEKVRNLLMAYRHTGQKVFLEEKLPLTDKNIGLLPAYGVGQMSKVYPRWDKSGFSFDNVSDQPRNPEHQADSLELEIMDYFRKEDSDETVFKPFTNEKGEKYYIYARPIWIKKPCLKCHSTPENAPKTIRERYDTADNYNLGDLRGILSIKMPYEIIEDRASHDFHKNVIILFLGMAFIFIIVMLIIKKNIIQPLSLLSEAMLDVSNGNFSRRMSGLSGEFEDMQKTFNVMGYELEINQQHLEKRVAERTAELSSTNQVLNETLASLQKAQQHIIESEKMAALGGLVAGVAHEINTPIGVSVTAASNLESLNSSLQKKFETSPLKKSDLINYLNDSEETGKIILNNLQRAAELIRSFKQIAVDQSQNNNRQFKLYQYINEILLSLKPTLKKTSQKVELNCLDSIEINCNPGQFTQIITNLIMNSIKHGFEISQAGIIKIDINQDQNQDKTITHFHFSDNGKGMPKETLAKIFTPFFTTARNKGGSGLGLSTIYNIITQNMGGTIRCESVLGKGTDFYFDIQIQAK